MLKTMNVILGKTQISRVPDYNADDSELGEFTDTPAPGHIVRGNHPVFVEDWPENLEFPTRRHEYIFFIPPDSGNEIGTEDYRKCALQDYQRMEAYQRGEWGYIGISVASWVGIETNNITVLADNIVSSLFQIESDCQQMDLDEVVDELKEEQRKRLQMADFTDEEIDVSFSTCDWKV